MDIWDVEAAKKARGCGARRAAGHCPTLQARGPPLQLRRAAVLPAVALPGDGAPSRRLRRRPSASTAAFRGIWRPTLSGGRPWARAASGWSGGRPTACMRRLLGGLAACDQTMMYSGRECLAPLRPGRSTGPLRVRPTCQCQRRRRRRPSRPPSCRQPLPRVVKEKSTGIEYACKSIAKALDIPNLSGAGCCRRRRRQRRWGPHGAAPGRRAGGRAQRRVQARLLPSLRTVLAVDKLAQHLDNIKREIKILTRLRGTLRCAGAGT